MNILLLAAEVVPETGKTLDYYLLAAIAALSTVVVYLYKQSEKHRLEVEKLRDKHEERLLIHNNDIRGLLEKTLIAFNEVEKKIFEVEEGGNKVIREAVVESQDKIIGAMEKMVNDIKK